MKIILVKEVESLGSEGDIVEVKPGFARNYLLPKKFAIEATKGNLGQIDQLKKKRMLREQKELERLQQVIDKVEGLTLEFERKAGEKGKLYGSVTNKEIAEAISERLGMRFDRKYLELEDHIKEVGKKEVPISLGKGQTAIVTVIVKAEGAEEATEEQEKEKKKGAREEKPTAEAPVDEAAPESETVTGDEIPVSEDENEDEVKEL